MEKETNVLHVLVTHPIALFIVAAFVLILLLLGVVALVNRWTERNRVHEQDGDKR